MNEVHQRWSQLPVLWRLFNAMVYLFISHTENVCYATMILTHAQSSCLLTLPLALIVFLWAALVDRPPRTVWMICIFYSELIIVIMLGFKFSFLPWTSQEVGGNGDSSDIGRFIGISDEPISIAMYSLLILSLFTQRHCMRRRGDWWQPVRWTTKTLNTCGLVGFFKSVFNPTYPSPRDYYDWCILSDVIALLILVLFFSDFDIAKRNVLAFESELKLLPNSFVVLFLLFSAMMLADRIIYLRRAVKMKFALFIMETLVTHILVFIVIPIQRGSGARTSMVFRRINFGLFAWYLARCWHMIGSAFQIRHGYPQFTVGRALKKSNPISWCIYMAFFLAPPLFEISVLIDWTFSETSLGLFDFYNVEVIDYRLYLIYGIRKLEVFYARDRGSKVHPVAKALLGGGILFGICSVVVMALTLLSETVMYYQHMEDLPEISEHEFDELVDYSHSIAHKELNQLLANLDRTNVHDFLLPDETVPLYRFAKWRSSLIKNLNDSVWSKNTDSLIKLKTRILIDRVHIRAQDGGWSNIMRKSEYAPVFHAREWEMTLNKLEVKELLRILQSTKCNDTYKLNITEIIWPVLLVPETVLLVEQHFPHYHRKNFEYRKNNYNYSTDLVISVDCDEQSMLHNAQHNVRIVQVSRNLEGRPTEKGHAPRYIILVAKVTRSFVKTFFKSMKSSLFAVMVLGSMFLSYKVRMAIITHPYQFSFNEMGDPRPLIRLCSSIFEARNAKMLELEHDLYGELLYIIKSPDTLLRETEYDMYKLC